VYLGYGFGHEQVFMKEKTLEYAHEWVRDPYLIPKAIGILNYLVIEKNNPNYQAFLDTYLHADKPLKMGNRMPNMEKYFHIVDREGLMLADMYSKDSEVIEYESIATGVKFRFNNLDQLLFYLQQMSFLMSQQAESEKRIQDEANAIKAEELRQKLEAESEKLQEALRMRKKETEMREKETDMRGSELKEKENLKAEIEMSNAEIKKIGDLTKAMNDLLVSVKGRSSKADVKNKTLTLSEMLKRMKQNVKEAEELIEEVSPSGVDGVVDGGVDGESSETEMSRINFLETCVFRFCSVINPETGVLRKTLQVYDFCNTDLSMIYYWLYEMTTVNGTSVFDSGKKGQSLGDFGLLYGNDYHRKNHLQWFNLNQKYRNKYLGEWLTQFRIENGWYVMYDQPSRFCPFFSRKPLRKDRHQYGDRPKTREFISKMF
jgi:hypothetical protein